MQVELNNYKSSLWASMRHLYKDYLYYGEQLNYQTVRQILIHEVHGNCTNRNQLYKLSYHMDMDSNGTISFKQLGNYLIKTYCKQISLWNYTRQLNARGEYLFCLKIKDFLIIINNAFAFLNVAMDQRLASQLFRTADRNNSGTITITQFYDIISNYFCEPQRRPSPPKPNKKRHLKLRISLWATLEKAYNLYLSNRNKDITYSELMKLVVQIKGSLTIEEENLVITKMFAIDIKVINFKSFASRFFYVLGDLGLSKFSKEYSFNKRHLELQEFIDLVTQSYSFGYLEKFKNTLTLIFKKISQNGRLTYARYLYYWVKRYLCESQFCDDDLCIPEDQQKQNPEQDHECQPSPPSPCDPNFNFHSYSLANAVRNKICFRLQRHDFNRSNYFGFFQARNAIRYNLKICDKALKATTNEALRYDFDGNGGISCDQLASFIAEKLFDISVLECKLVAHFFHKGWKNQMDQFQFIRILDQRLYNLEIQQQKGEWNHELVQLWKDVTKNGQYYCISFERYNLFVQHYFGRFCKQHHHHEQSEFDRFMKKYLHLKPIDRFSQMVLDQVRVIFKKFDTNYDGRYNRQQIWNILNCIFKYNYQQITLIMRKLTTSYCQSLRFDKLMLQLLTIYFNQTTFQCGCNEPQQNYEIKQDQFVNRIIHACYFLKFRPLQDDLRIIFRDLHRGRGFIYYREYVHFILVTIGGDCFCDDQEQKKRKPCDCDQTSKEFKSYVWTQMQQKFVELQRCCRRGHLKTWDVFEWMSQNFGFSCSQLHSKYNFRKRNYDPNADEQISFNQFGRFVIIFVIQEMYHKYMEKHPNMQGKLFYQDFWAIMRNSFGHFMDCFWKWSYRLDDIFRPMTINAKITTSQFLNWRFYCLAGQPK